MSCCVSKDRLPLPTHQPVLQVLVQGVVDTMDFLSVMGTLYHGDLYLVLNPRHLVEWDEVNRVWIDRGAVPE